MNHHDSIKPFDFDQFYDQENQLIINKLITTFTKLDQKILETRDKKYQVFQITNRTIITWAGKIVFKRRIYRYWNYQQGKWNYIALLDQKLGLEKGKNISNHLKQHIGQYLASGKRYQDIIDTLKYAKVSKMTISRIFKSKTIKPKTTKLNLQSSQYLYLNIDDTYVPLRKGKTVKKYPIRSLTFYTNKVAKKLINQRVTAVFNPHQYPLIQWKSIIMEIINQFYDHYDHVRFVVSGDGAPWIKTITQQLQGQFILDKFHALNRLRKLIIKSNNNIAQHLQYEQAKNYFNHGHYDQLITYLKLVKPQQKLTYWINNQTGIINQALTYNLGNMAENMISLTIKNLLGYGNRIFNYDTFENMVAQQCQKFQ